MEIAIVFEELIVQNAYSVVHHFDMNDSVINIKQNHVIQIQLNYLICRP